MSSAGMHPVDAIPERRGSSQSLAWGTLSTAAQLYVLTVLAAGTAAALAWFPTGVPQPWLFVLLLIASCLTSLWKINLPIPLASGSTLSVSYAANLMALLLLGPQQALVIALAGVWIQCTVNVRRPYPWYRTAFSIAAEALTMAATGLVYLELGGPLRPVEFAPLAGPLIAAIATYFFVNTGLIAVAIALTSDRSVREVWLEDFSWSGASFMVAGTAGAVAAVVIARGGHWPAVLMLAPVYLTYRTYQVFIGRLEDRDRHAREARRLHRETTDALSLARQAEQALAAEKDLLAATVAELTRLEGVRQELLERERAARASAEEGNRLKDQFLATVSHELRTPLNAILGWADMLRSPEIVDSIRDRAGRSIYDNARQQSRMIDELLDVARIVSGKLRLERTAVDLNEIVRAAVEVVQGAAEAKRVAIVVRDRRVESYDLRRRRAAATDCVESAVECRQVHRRGRADRRADSPRAGGRRNHRHRRWRRHSRRVPAVRVRAVPPGRRVQHATLRRAGAGSVDRQASGGGAWRHHHRVQRRRGPRVELYRSAACPRGFIGTGRAASRSRLRSRSHLTRSTVALCWCSTTTEKAARSPRRI